MCEQVGEHGNNRNMSFFNKIKSGLSKSSSKISDGLNEIFIKKKLDQDALDELEELLITADLGVSAAGRIVQSIADKKFDAEITPEGMKAALASEVAVILEPYAKPLDLSDHKPHVLMVVGVNGNGKTTTIGKLAKQWQAEGKKVMLAAADTFRAAAIEQLGVWAERNGCKLISAEIGSDPASVAFQAYEAAKAECVDILIVDTAGRLQNKNDLMQELQKITRVIKKVDDAAPHSVLQVVDATTGQNAISQVETFKEMIGVTGLAVTKLDGSAKGGVMVALAEKTKLPIHVIGVGEGIDDLQPFTADDFAKSLVG